MKFKFTIPVFLLMALVAFPGCEKLEDLNENPNQPEEVTADVLLPGVIRDMSNTLVGHAFYISNCAAQLNAKSLRTEIDVYNWNSAPLIGFEQMWPAMYGALRDIQNIETLATESGNDQMLGVALTLKAFAFHNLTDTYGDIPYSEALGALSDGVFFPSYDDQQSIYTGEGGLFEMLDDANDLLASGSGSINGDLIYGGDASLWQRFANSLHLRLLLHASTQIDVSAQFAEVAARPLMEGNAHNAQLEYLNAFPNEFPLLPFKVGDFESVRFGEQAFQQMTATNDPRMMQYARPTNTTINTDNPEYEGWINGSENADPPCDVSGSAIGLAYYDYPGHPVAAEKAPGVWMTYAELQFILAEASLNGWVGSDAQTHYEAGITASMIDHDADPADTGLSGVADFIAQPEVAWDGSIERLREQKWVALYFHGMEPYFEVRRWYYQVNGDWAQLPFLTPPCENTNGDMLPQRFIYPGEEQSLNPDSYANALSGLGGVNDFNARMWLVQN